MKFFIDENIPKSVADYLKSQGNIVIDIRGTDDEGAQDNIIFEKALFITTDRDFYHTIPYLYKSHSGVIVIALNQPNRNKIMEKNKMGCC